MNINEAGLNLVKEFEGLRLKPYYCAANVLTIGYGSTGSHVRPGMVITREEADSLLRKDIERFERMVERELSHVHLNSNQFSALVSLCFNCGSAPIKPGMTIRRCLDAGDYEGAANGFLLWVKAGGRTLAGLVTRRNRERDLFLEPTSRERYVILIHHNTFLKKSPVQSSELSKGELINLVSPTYLEGEFVGEEAGHYIVKIKGQTNYIFKGHAHLATRI